MCFTLAHGHAGIFWRPRKRWMRSKTLRIMAERRHRLMTSLDNLNRRFGSGTLFPAAEGIKPRWSMRRELKSPSYTTRLSDVPVVYC